MTWTRVALDILGIPEFIYERDSDYDATFRLLTALVEGITAHSFNYRPRLCGRQLNSAGVFDQYALGRTAPAGLRYA